MTLKQKDDKLEIAMTVDGQAFGTETVSYESVGGYGKADTPLGPFSVTLGPGLLGMGSTASAAYFEGQSAGVYTNSQMLSDYSCE